MAEHPQYLIGFYPPPELVALSNQRLIAEDLRQAFGARAATREATIMHARTTLANMRQQWRRENPSPSFTCPKCRQRLTKKPVCVLVVKDMVSKLAKLIGEDEPVERHEGRRASARDVGGVWDGFFPEE